MLSSAYAASPIVLQRGDVFLTQEDVVMAVNTYVPENARGELLANEAKLRDFVAQLFAIRVLNEDAKSRTLNADERWKVDSAAERARAQIQLEHVVATSPKPDFEQAAFEFYKAHPTNFTEPEQVRVEHVLVRTEGRSDQEALERAHEALLLVKGGGKSFGEIASEYSDDPSVKRNNGDLGFFGRGRMVKEFEDAAFALTQNGEVVGPVKTQFGYHVIRFVERKAEKVTPFEKVKDKLLSEEALKFKRARITEEYQRIGKLPGIEVNQEAIRALVVPFDAKTVPTN
jgi:parvulin-like peptidyl-prolyl isomerase